MLVGFAERLKKLRENKGLTQQELAELLGISRSAVTKYETGERFPDEAMLKKIAGVLGASLDTLLGHDSGAPDDFFKPGDLVPAGDVLPVPVVGVIRAGEPVLATENIVGYAYLPAREVKGGTYFYLRVKGDSMSGARIHDGDLVLVRQQDTCEDGEIAVVLLNDEEATLKRVYRTGGMMVLQPENPAYRPMVVREGEARILGVVREVRFKV